jgi:hypothetical protein
MMKLDTMVAMCKSRLTTRPLFGYKETGQPAGQRMGATYALPASQAQAHALLVAHVGGTRQPAGHGPLPLGGR